MRFTFSWLVLFPRFQVGDQIIRVNGYPVEDAVHQEVALLAKNQQVLVLKIRSNYSFFLSSSQFLRVIKECNRQVELIARSFRLFQAWE